MPLFNGDNTGQLESVSKRNGGEKKHGRGSWPNCFFFLSRPRLSYLSFPPFSKKKKKNSQSVIWSAILVFGTALACFVCLRLTRARIAARRREEAMVIAAQRAQIDAAEAAAAAAAEAGEGGGRGGRGRRPSSAAAATAAPRLSRTMIARLPTFNYVDPPAGQESDGEEGGDEESGFVKGGGGGGDKGTAAAAAGEQPSGGGDAAAAAAPPPPTKKTFARSSSSGKRRCIVCLDPL